MADLGMRIKSLRNEKGLTQEEFGFKFGVAKSTVSFYENGRSAPDNDTLIKIANFFNVTTDYLLGRTNVREQDDTIAAHHEGDWTESELEEIESFKKFLRSKRNG